MAILFSGLALAAAAWAGMTLLGRRYLSAWPTLAAAAAVGACLVWVVAAGRPFGVASSISIALAAFTTAVVAVVALWWRARGGGESRNTPTDLAELLDKAPVLVWKTDAQGRCIFVNAGWLRFTGRRLKDEIDAGWFESVHPEDRAALETAYGDAVRLRREFTLRYRLRCADGSYRWILAHGRPLRKALGQFAGFCGSCVDFTDQFQADLCVRQSDARFRALIQAAGSVIVLLSPSGRVLEWNREAEWAFGHSRDRALGRHHRELGMPDGLINIEALADSVGKFPPEPFRSESSTSTPNGRRLWHAWEISPLCGDGREIEAVILIGHDVSELKRADQKLAKDERLLRTLIRALPELAYIKDADGRFLIVNKALADIAGAVDSREMIGKSDFDFFPPELARRFQADDQAVMNSGRAIENGEEPLIDHEGNTRWMLTTKVPVFDETGKAVGIIGISFDITGRKLERERLDQYLLDLESAKFVTEQQAAALIEQSEELQRARDSALESARLKSEFLANMSHEIRTPMNGIIGMAALVLDTALDAEQRQFAQTIYDSAEALMTILNDILDFSKIEAGKLSLESVPFDLRAAIADSVELLAARAREKGLELVTRYPRGEPTAFQGDPGRLRQVLTNLIGNAIKFTASGQVCVTVKFSPRDGDSIPIRCEVQDSGIGIPSDKLGYIFDKFTQADASTTRKFGGTGLGLAICKQLIEMMGGRIGAESEPGRGSMFWFEIRLPVDAATGPASEPPASLKDSRILVADRNCLSARALAETLSRSGLRAVPIESGSQLIGALEPGVNDKDAFCFALVDPALPGLDMAGLRRAIDSNPSLSGSLVLLRLAPGAEEGMPPASTEPGFAGQINRPVRIASLLALLAATRASGSGPRGQAARLAVDSGDAFKRPVANAEHQRVLLAEDGIVNQKIVVRMLEKFGYGVEVVDNGRKAVEQAQSGRFALVLMDCQMPEMDGYEASTAIRNLPEPAGSVPIIALTANAMQGDRERCLDAGMSDYLTKPLRPKELREALERWIPVEVAEPH